MASKKRPAAAQTRAPKEKTRKDKGQGPLKAEITVILTDKQAYRFIKNAKVITAPELARQTGVKTSAANRYLKDAVKAGSIKRVGGFSGHWLYQPVSS